MKSTSKNSKFNENNNNNLKINLKNNIPKAQSRKDIKKKQINKRATNYFNLNNNNINQINSKTISSKDYKPEEKNISNYISINKSFLLDAYEKSLLILFDTLRLYMKNDLHFFNELKDNFIKNVHIFYQKGKNKFSILLPNSTKSKTNSKITFNQNNTSHNNMNNINNINHLSSKSFFGLSDNSLSKSKSNISKQASLNNIKKNITYKKSLYSLTKESNKALMPKNNNLKKLAKKDYNLTILKNFLEFNKNLKYNRTKNSKNIFNNKTDKDINNNIKEKNNINKTTNNNNNINNFYYNKIINKIPNDYGKKGEESNENNNLIACIKNSLDDNLKNMFDFSYQSFLNKESEREG